MKKRKAKILLVEDDPNLGIVLSDFFEMSNFSVILATDGVAGLEEFKNQVFDLCILDIMLPKKDGYELAEEIKKIAPEIPLIFLTAKVLETDRIKGLKLGADDYITKPFSTEELNLRINAILRRSKYSYIKHDSPTVFNIGRYTYDYSNYFLQIDSNKTRLTKKEAEVLRLLCLNMNRIVKREVVLKNIWGEDDYFMGRSMDVYITKLRKLLKDDPNVLIVNIPRTGFKLEVLE